MWYNLNLKKKKINKKNFCVLVGGGGGGATALMAQSQQRGHNELGPTKKKIMCSLIFCTDATYKISSS